MKRKVVKVKSSKDLTKRISGVGTFRVTGPSIETGKRVTVIIEGTREEAEQVVLK